MRDSVRFRAAVVVTASLILSTVGAPGPAKPATAGVPAAGYWIADAAGGVHALGGASAHGSLPRVPDHPVVGVAATPAGTGYWLVAADGGVFAFGDAGYVGSVGGQPLNAAIVGMAATRSGRGYWLVAADGGVFSFGDAPFHGSTGALRLNAPITGMAATPTGAGYWLVAADGGVFSFGDAPFHGSTGDRVLNRPVVGLAATPSGGGYWFVAADGGIFSFGDARFHGSTGALRLNAPITSMAPTGTGQGYWLVATDGGVFSFGNAPFLGSVAGGPLSAPVAGLAAAGTGSGSGSTAGVVPLARPGDSGGTGSPGAFTIGLLGDTGYTAEQEEDLLRVRDDMNRFPLAFTVHDGDIWSGSTECTDARYAEVRAIFDGFAHPVVYTPGDNEWADCDDPDDRLAHLRTAFFSTADTLGARRFTVERQDAPYVENARWTAGGVVFATVNEPGATGSGGSLRDAGLAWLDAAFDRAEDTDAPAVMVVCQDNPFSPSGGALYRRLRERTVSFGRPVVLVHGDTHQFRIDHPWPDLPSFTRVETFAGDDSHKWVRATVDPGAPHVFSFAEMRS